MSVASVLVPRNRALLNIMTTFNQQVDTLLRRNYHATIGMDDQMFRKILMGPLLDRLTRYYERRETALADYGTLIPFLIVFPHTVITRQVQLSLISNDGIRGEAIFKLKEPIKNRSARFDKPYLAMNVDPGTQLQGMSIDESIKQINAQERGGGTLDEAIALATHRPDILAIHGIDCLGTLTSDGLTPCIQYRNNCFVISKHFPHLPPPPGERFGPMSVTGMIKP